MTADFSHEEVIHEDKSYSDQKKLGIRRNGGSGVLDILE